jgi:hypothetical protein
MPQTPPTLLTLTLCALTASALWGCDTKLDVAPIEDNIQQSLKLNRDLTVTVSCPKDRKFQQDSFVCAVSLADGLKLDAQVEVSEHGEVSWTVALDSRAYIEATLKQAIALRRHSPADLPLVPKSLTCPDTPSPNPNPAAPIFCEVIWPNGEAAQIEVNLSPNNDASAPTWRAQTSLRMYDTPDALTADLSTRAQTTAQIPVQTLSCGTADTLVLGLPLLCDATLVGPQPQQKLSITLTPNDTLRFALVP